MALPALAAPADLAVRLGRTLDTDETTRAQALLEDASGIVRAYTGQQFSRVENDTVTLRVDRGRVVLPQRPADKPTQIVNADGVSGTIPAFGWWWGGLEVVEFTAPSWVANGPEITNPPRAVTVTYSHGYDVIPAEVVAVVCQMVARVMSLPVGMMVGLRSGGVDDFQFALGGGITSGAIALVPEERAVLDRYRRRTGSQVLR